MSLIAGCCLCKKEIGACRALGGWGAFGVSDDDTVPFYDWSTFPPTLEKVDEYDDRVRLLFTGYTPADDPAERWELAPLETVKEYLDEKRTVVITLDASVRSKRSEVNSLLTAIGSTIQWTGGGVSFDGLAEYSNYAPSDIGKIHCVNPEVLTGGLWLYRVGNDVVATIQSAREGRIVVLGDARMLKADERYPAPPGAFNSEFFSTLYTLAICDCKFPRMPNSWAIDFPPMSRSLPRVSEFEFVLDNAYDTDRPRWGDQTAYIKYRREYPDLSDVGNGNLLAPNPGGPPTQLYQGFAGVRHHYLEKRGIGGGDGDGGEWGTNPCYPEVIKYATAPVSEDVDEHRLCGFTTGASGHPYCGGGAYGIYIGRWKCNSVVCAFRFDLGIREIDGVRYWWLTMTQFPVYENIQYFVMTYDVENDTGLKRILYTLFYRSSSYMRLTGHYPQMPMREVGWRYREIRDAINDEFMSNYNTNGNTPMDSVASELNGTVYAKPLECTPNLAPAPVVLPLYYEPPYGAGGETQNEVNGLTNVPESVTLTPGYLV